MRFHGRHGRLPGANQVVQAAQSAPSETPARAPTTAQAAPSHSMARSILIATLILAGVVLAWFLLPDEQAADPGQSSHESSVPHDRADADGQFLIVGMDEGGVRRIQGEPAFLSTDRWEYGPSYVRFERHKVVGWYSSPLYPLKTGPPSRRTSKNTD
jgi:hypothetical protein